MNDSRVKNQRIAKQLGVSVQVLEQYLQGKRAEVAGEMAPREATVKPRRLEREWREHPKR